METSGGISRAMDATERTPLVGKVTSNSYVSTPSSYKSCTSPIPTYPPHRMGSSFGDNQPEVSPTPPIDEDILFLDEDLEAETSSLLTIQSLFFDACLSGDAFQVERIIESNPKDAHTLVSIIHPKYNMAALAITAYYDQPLVMRYLLDETSCKENVDAIAGVERHGATALMLVQSVPCAMMLLNSGASVHAQNSTGMTPLHYAASAGHAGIVSLLLNAGADPNCIDHRGATPLHWAVYVGYQYTAMLLVGQGADMSIQDTQGQTPLMIAAALNDSFLVKQLVLEGSPLDLCDRKGRTAMMIATHASNRECIHALKTGKNDRWVAYVSTRWATVIFFWVALSSTTILSAIFTLPVLPYSLPFGSFLFVLWILTCILYLYVWLSDPGYIEKSNQPAHELLALDNPMVPCPSCVTIKPIRSKHCATCRRCVDRFDHHCPWINNCVGKKNHRGFVLFLAILSTYCLILATCSMLILLGVFPLEAKSGNYWEENEPALVASFKQQQSEYTLQLIHVYIMAFGYAFGLPTMVLFGLQVRNICMSLTTNEVFNKSKYSYLKNPMDKFSNPFDHGPRSNCFSFWLNNT